MNSPVLLSMRSQVFNTSPLLIVNTGPSGALIAIPYCACVLRAGSRMLARSATTKQTTSRAGRTINRTLGVSMAFCNIRTEAVDAYLWDSIRRTG
jgi:hypothetical protein